MVRRAQASLDCFTVIFSPYQYRQFRIIEFLRYATFARWMDLDHPGAVRARIFEIAVQPLVVAPREEALAHAIGQRSLAR